MISKIDKFFDAFDINQLACGTGFCKREFRKLSPVDFSKSFCIDINKSKYSLRNWSVVQSSLIGECISF
jgi:hypothetical protein